MWSAGALLWLSACSGATDVVGVIDQNGSEPTSVGGANVDRANVDRANVNRATLEGPSGSAAGLGISANGSGNDDASALLVVAGLWLRDWSGPTFSWPLSVRLRTFFADSSWPSRSLLPDQLERDAFERMGVYSDQRHDDVRFVASKGDVAEVLRGLFSEAKLAFGAEPRSLVTRDAWGDEYLVVLGENLCLRNPSHHGDPCADLGDNPSETGFDAP